MNDFRKLEDKAEELRGVWKTFGVTLKYSLIFLAGWLGHWLWSLSASL